MTVNCSLQSMPLSWKQFLIKAVLSSLNFPHHSHRCSRMRNALDADGRFQSPCPLSAQEMSTGCCDRTLLDEYMLSDCSCCPAILKNVCLIPGTIPKNLIYVSHLCSPGEDKIINNLIFSHRLHITGSSLDVRYRLGSHQWGALVWIPPYCEIDLVSESQDCSSDSWCTLGFI